MSLKDIADVFSYLGEGFGAGVVELLIQSAHASFLYGTQSTRES